MTASYSSYAGSRTEKFFHEREREREDFQWVPIVCVCMYVCLIFSFVGRRALATFSERDLCVRVRLAGLPQSPIYTFELLIPFRVFSIYFFSLLSFSGLRHCCAPHTIVVPVSVVMGSRRWAHRSLTTTTTTCTDSVVVPDMQWRWNANTEENSFRLSVRSDPLGHLITRKRQWAHTYISFHLARSSSQDWEKEKWAGTLGTLANRQQEKINRTNVEK